MAIYREPSEVWDELTASQSSDGGLPVGAWAGGLILMNLDALGMPVFIVEAAGRREIAADTSEFATYGVQVQTRTLRLDSRTAECVVFGARDRTDIESFIRMADLLVAELLRTEVDDDSDLREVVFELLRRWVNFWRRLGGGLSVEKIVGLVGELLAITDWSALDGFSHENWGGPMGEPQDFQFPGAAVEVKTSQSRTGPRIHRISSVLQLDDPNVENLYLISYRIKLHANGSRQIFEIVDEILRMPEFVNSEAIEKLNRALTEVGLTRSSPKKYLAFDVFDCRLYRVTGDFPRLLAAEVTRSSSVFDVKYSIDLSGSDEYLLADKPVALRGMHSWNS